MKLQNKCYCLTIPAIDMLMSSLGFPFFACHVFMELIRYRSQVLGVTHIPLI